MIKVYNLGQLDDVVAKFIETTRQRYRKKFDTMMSKIAMLIQSDIADHFDKAQGPKGAWNPLKHPRPGGGTKFRPLQDTGVLRRAATTRHAPGNITRINGSTIELGVNLPYAAIHNEGGTIKPVNAKFLAAPATLEAKRAGSPRRFPRKLVAIINKAGTGGVLVEAPKKGKKTRKKTGRAAPKKNVVHYYLFKQAEIPARPYMWISNKCMGYIDKLAVKTFREMLRERAQEENQ